MLPAGLPLGWRAGCDQKFSNVRPAWETTRASSGGGLRGAERGQIDVGKLRSEGQTGGNPQGEWVRGRERKE